MRDKNLPLYARYVMNHHGNLFSSAQRRFGPWSKAHLLPAPKGRLDLLNPLSDALERHTVKNVPQSLKLEAEHYFGSQVA
jgi:hypothetical protein